MDHPLIEIIRFKEGGIVHNRGNVFGVHPAEGGVGGIGFSVNVRRPVAFGDDRRDAVIAGFQSVDRYQDVPGRPGGLLHLKGSVVAVYHLGIVGQPAAAGI